MFHRCSVLIGRPRRPMRKDLRLPAILAGSLKSFLISILGDRLPGDFSNLAVYCPTPVPFPSPQSCWSSSVHSTGFEDTAENVKPSLSIETLGTLLLAASLVALLFTAFSCGWLSRLPPSEFMISLSADFSVCLLVESVLSNAIVSPSLALPCKNFSKPK